MLLAERPGDRYWALIEPHWLPLNEAWDLSLDEFLATLHQVPPRVADLYAAHWCQSEVRNGGFHQFFFNTTGLLAPEAVGGFRAIGLLEWAALLAEAMNYFDAPYPRDRVMRLDLLPEDHDGDLENSDPFAELDDRFFSCVDAEPTRWEKSADLYAVQAA
ncbi:MAG TPA: DUF4375 domain-containing protein [Nitrospiraceae bacterium]|nr:DUF4375 domain-containing protein [Nitrospiraceae bacterium]